jgi:hypothetical protein
MPPRRPGSNNPDFKVGAGGGSICVDGFLNIGDEALYHVNEFKLPGQRREIQRYWTGGRPFANGTVVFVSGIGSSSSTFDVAIQGTIPLRRLVDVPLLNGAVNVGANTTLVTRAGTTDPFLARPGSSLNIDGVFLNPGGNSSVPVEIVSITDPGTSGALVTVQALTDNGDRNTAASLTGSVVPIPNPEFVIVGDQGTFLNSAVLNTNPTVPGTGEQEIGEFFVSNRQNFLKFT